MSKFLKNIKSVVQKNQTVIENVFSVQEGMIFLKKGNVLHLLERNGRDQTRYDNDNNNNDTGKM